MDSSYDLVRLILGKITQRSDLARCSIVSKLWLECSTAAKAALVGVPHLVGLVQDWQVLSLNLVTGEHHYSDPGCRCTGHPYWGDVLATCRGLVLLLGNNRELTLGEPSVSKWLKLPTANFDVAAAALVRDEPGLDADEILLVIMDKRGRIDRYEIEDACWVQQSEPLEDMRFSRVISDLVYHQHGFIGTFCDGNDNVRIMWCGTTGMWVEASFTSSRDREFLGSFFVTPMHWHGRLFVLSAACNIAELVLEEHDGVLKSEFVEQREYRELMAGFMSKLKNAWGCMGHGGDLFWKCLGDDHRRMVKLSLNDLTTATYNLINVRGWYPRFFIPDEGEALFRFVRGEGGEDVGAWDRLLRLLRNLFKKLLS